MNTYVANPDMEKLAPKPERKIALKDLLLAHPDVSPFAEGWYVIEFSKKIRTDRLISKKFLGEEVVIYRDSQSGNVIVVQAHCPHMGAHFDSYQNGGCVKDGVLTCPYHLLKYDADGKCQGAKENNHRAHLKKFHTMEHNGFVLAYFQHDNDKTPPPVNLDIPDIDPAEFAFMSHTLGKFDGDPMVPLMANADMNHFFSVHGSKPLKPTRSFEISGDGREAHFGFEVDMNSEIDQDYPRGGGLRLLRKSMVRSKLKAPDGRKLPGNTTVDSYCRGPGLVMSRWVQPYMGVEALTWVYATPSDISEYEVFMVQALKTLREIKPKFLQKLVNKVLVRGYAWLMDVFVGHEDPPFYNKLKIRLAKPVFIKNDIHLVKYTSWWKSLAPKEFQAICEGKNIDFS